jgi:hypothetical protein
MAERSIQVDRMGFRGVVSKGRAMERVGQRAGLGRLRVIN